MKQLFVLPLLLILLAFKGDACKPLSDGIYVYKLDSEHSAVIRFYDDKTVLVSTSVNNYADVMSWLNRDPENFSRVLTGKYKMSGCAIRFKVKGETGYEKFEGTVSGNTISMHIVNPNGTATDREYAFVKP